MIRKVQAAVNVQPASQTEARGSQVPSPYAAPTITPLGDVVGSTQGGNAGQVDIGPTTYDG